MIYQVKITVCSCIKGFQQCQLCFTITGIIDSILYVSRWAVSYLTKQVNRVSPAVIKDA